MDKFKQGFFSYTVDGTAAVTHLTFGSNAYVSADRCLWAQVDGLLNADISQGIFAKDRTSIKVGRHEAAEARQSLVCQRKARNLCSATGWDG